MPAVPSFRTPTGTRDVLPPESGRWRALISSFDSVVTRAGYGLVVSPMFEDVEVFQRVGESTDVVRKEMYDFEDKGGRRLALRPEGTASVVRAYVQHRPTPPWKVWYCAPSFRYERPQAGRYRQHHQLGVEALGAEDPELDVEVIGLARCLYDALGLGRVTLVLNSIGDPVCRPAYIERLDAYLVERDDQLCGEHRRGARQNPLRVLDCKRAECREATASAPRIVDHLCEACTLHFRGVQDSLVTFGIDFVLDARLVRGFDYYTRTAFEFQASALESAQSTIGAGGRYDGLVEALGGPPTPGVGFGIGIERVLLACDAEGVGPAPDANVDVWVIDITGSGSAGALAWDLRRAGIAADRGFDARSMRAQMKLADRSGARLALIVGDEERRSGTVSVRDLRADDADQRVVARDAVVALVKELLA
ncbi:MAG TPA: histidine--tRNA ligase [Acidimicrobiales bacterium]|nr:histidine--tRNA ligase [Acidimicrobiales bacterium]